jgi:hypothetical protein
MCGWQWRARLVLRLALAQKLVLNTPEHAIVFGFAQRLQCLREHCVKRAVLPQHSLQ